MSKLVALFLGLSCVSTSCLAAVPQPYVPDSPVSTKSHSTQVHKKVSVHSAKAGQIQSLTDERLGAINTFSKNGKASPAKPERAVATVTAKRVTPAKAKKVAVTKPVATEQRTAAVPHRTKLKLSRTSTLHPANTTRIAKNKVPRYQQQLETKRAPTVAYRATPRVAATDPVTPPARMRTFPLANTAGVNLQSHAALVMNAETGHMIYGKNAADRTPIASISKLMTAMVTLDAHLDMDQSIRIADADVDRLKMSSSRLEVGTTLSRHDTMWLALMSSENRAAAALARTYPGGKAAFVTAMNRKARSLGMNHTIFHDPTGLNKFNTSTAADLALMVQAAYRYPLIRQFTTTTDHDIVSASGRQLHYINSNALVREGDWNIELSKTGYIKEAGHCLVMVTEVQNKPMIMVFLDSSGSMSRISDAKNLKNWLDRHPLNQLG